MNTQYAIHRRPGNTAVRRKNISGHSVIAEATKATGAVMASQMQEIADASRELERSKIEVQLKLFSEQMEYQREKDRRMYENAVMANDNARLAILKQGEMVTCLSQLSTVLNRGLTMSTSAGLQNMGPGATQHFTSGLNFTGPGFTAGTTSGTNGSTAAAQNLSGPLKAAGIGTTVTGLHGTGRQARTESGEHAGTSTPLDGLTTVTDNGGGSNLDGTLPDNLKDKNK